MVHIPRSTFHLTRLLYVRPETFGPTLVYYKKYALTPLNKSEMTASHIEAANPRYEYLTNVPIIVHKKKNKSNNWHTVSMAGLFGKYSSFNKTSRLGRQTNNGESFDECHIYRQSVGNGQVASNCTSAPFPRCGKYLWLANICQNYKIAGVQSKHNYISYEWVDHIEVNNYMFLPLSAIIRLYYFLL
jgi:hypothetical protein